MWLTTRSRDGNGGQSKYISKRERDKQSELFPLNRSWETVGYCADLSKAGISKSSHQIPSDTATSAVVAYYPQMFRLVCEIQLQIGYLPVLLKWADLKIPKEVVLDNQHGWNTQRSHRFTLFLIHSLYIYTRVHQHIILLENLIIFSRRTCMYLMISIFFGENRNFLKTNKWNPILITLPKFSEIQSARYSFVKNQFLSSGSKTQCIHKRFILT